MRRALLLILVIALVVAVASAESKKKRRHKSIDFSFSSPAKPARKAAKSAPTEAEEAAETSEQEQQQAQDASSSSSTEVEGDAANAVDTETVVVAIDLCRDLKCGAGRECRVNETSGQAKCQCVEECGYETDPRRQVCSNHNETFNTDCDLYRNLCLCEEADERCREPEKFKHIHIEYYGECRNIPECSEDELSDFPRRMREWLFNVMQELAERQELSKHYQQMEKQAEKDQAKRWRNAAVWKWCDLDGHPNDNVVSRHELFPVKAPLQALEHCIGDFLDSCDANDDHSISLQEWGACLELEEGDLIAECEKLEND